MRAIKKWLFKRLGFRRWHFWFQPFSSSIGWGWRYKQLWILWWGSRKFYKTMKAVEEQGMPTWHDWNQQDYIAKRQKLSAEMRDLIPNNFRHRY